ncbi:tripartite tricarboxylate transporter substrate binding protein [Paeniroseomonas aquatica]|uniref:Tripartite tricarboxylate transporter substrate binding protein n=1 Tax=Paeniroseomonas aquatica TaxID=373043 RepID=A0ABT8AG92_9PROT|nr:tripartite tricarboxylate transporter substrate binding protein [Paeniroseomonas aquatica]MDN3568705.1 tripartite tricarboxylate transporter substrate binding protein [Paeniroseomonas aquatica]
MLDRRCLVASLALGAGFTGARSTAAQEHWPSRPITLIVPFGAGGGTDILARLLAQHMADSLGQPMPIDNRAGASGTLGMAQLARARPDGYTVAIAPNGTYAMATALYDRLPYDIERAFAPVGMLATTPIFACVHPAAPWHSLTELIASAKAQPATITYASAGAGSTSHLFVELLLDMSGTQMVHVPYRSAAQTAQAVMQRETAMSFIDASVALPFMRSGEVRAIALTAPQRSAQAPEVPTVAESGFPGYRASVDFGLFAPAGTPQPILVRLASEARTAISLPQLQPRLESLAMEAVGGTPAELAASQVEETRRWAELIRRRGIRLE